MITPIPSGSRDPDQHQTSQNYTNFNLSQTSHNIICYRCKGRGHYARECKRPSMNSRLNGK